MIIVNWNVWADEANKLYWENYGIDWVYEWEEKCLQN